MSSSSPIRVVIADDHLLFRSGLRELLESIGGCEVVGDVGSAPELFTLNHAETPAVVVLDVEMPGPGPVRTTQRLISDNPSVGVVVLTMHDDPELVGDCIEAGAKAYLLKNADRAELTAAIRLAARTRDDVILIQLSRASALVLASRYGGMTLSARESEVLNLVAQAKTNREISTTLHISDATVKRHLTNVFAKLGATSRMDAVSRAQREGLIRRSGL